MRVLILSASIGGGHEAAAKALKSIILNANINSVVRIVDSLDYVNTTLNQTISNLYVKMARSTPKLFGLIYKMSDKESRLKNLIFFLNQVFSKKILPLINTFAPDVIVTTHMFPTEMISYLKSNGKTAVPLICVITDYAPHKTWLAKSVDAYVVASKDMIPKMLQLGIKSEQIYPLGIPISDSFFNKQNKSAIRKKFGLDPSIPAVLIMAGSFGIKSIFPIYTNLVSSRLNFQIILITGKNKKLFNNISKFIKNRKEKGLPVKKTKLVYFTNEVYKFMKTADLVITKPGGLTVSEALASGLPMVIFDAIPGQEEENADFLIKNNMGIRISTNENCVSVIEKLLTEPDLLKSMQSSCKMHSQFMSNESIYNLIKKLAEKT